MQFVVNGLYHSDYVKIKILQRIPYRAIVKHYI